MLTGSASFSILQILKVGLKAEALLGRRVTVSREVKAAIKRIGGGPPLQRIV
jgi:hypothetical protein